MQLIGVTKEEVYRESMLWSWRENDLHVDFYPKDQERATQAKRKAGKSFGKGKQKGSKQVSNSLANSLPNSLAKDKEKKRKEKESNTFPRASAPAPAKPEEKNEKEKDLTKKIEDIYLAFPKQQKKPQGLQAIARAITKKKLDPDWLYAKVKEYSISIVWQDMRFIPNCQTWFEAEQYNDDPETWKEPENLKGGDKKPKQLQGVQPSLLEEYPESEDF